MTLHRVLIARHGETEWNVAGRRQGRLDSRLTKRGRADATAIADLVGGEQIDMMCVSPLGRAQETAAIIAAATGLPRMIFDDLAELDTGRFSGLTVEQIEAEFPGALATRADDKYQWCFPAGESYADMDVRAERALAAIADAGVRRPLVVTHSMFSRMLLHKLGALEVDDALTFALPHAQVLDVRSNTRMRWLD